MLHYGYDSGFAAAILETIDLPVLALDAGLTVEIANAAFFRTFQVTAEDTIGRRIYDLGNGQWNIPELRRLLTDVLQRENRVDNYRVEHVFEGLGPRIMRLNASRIRRSDANDSILLAIADESEREALLHEMTSQREFADKVIDSVREGLVILDADLRVHVANDPFYELFKVDREATEGHLIHELGDGQWDIPELRQLLEHILPRESAFDDYEVHHDFAHIGHRVMVLNGRRLDHLNMIVLAIRDITDARESERARSEREERLSNSEERLRLALEAGGAIGVWDWMVAEDRVRSDANFARHYGISTAEAARGVPLARFIAGIHPGDRDRVWRAIRDALEHGSEFSEEYRLADDTAGDTLWVHALGRCRRGANGAPDRFPGVVVDITARKEAEAQLLADNKIIASQFAELEALYAEAPLGLALLDHELRFLRINAALAEINGFSVDDHLGRRAWDLIPNLRKAAEPALRHVLQTGTPLRDVLIKGETAAQPGVERAWREHFYPLRGDDGSIRGVGIVCEEVTARMAMERALAEKTALLEAVTGSLDAYVYAKDRDGRFLMVNDALCRRIGRTREEIIGKCDGDFFEAECAAEWRRNDLAVMARRETTKAEEAVPDAQGTRCSYFSVKSPLQNAAGEIVGIVGVTSDITEIKRVESALRENEARLAAITEHAPIAIGLCDRDGHWILKNPALQHIDGEVIPSRDPKERERWHAVDENGRPLPPEQWPGARALRGETVVPGVEFRTNISGEERWLKVSAAPVTNGGAVRQAVLIIEDITGRKQAEAQRELLMREVNHRSKNMLGVVQAIARATADGEEREFLRKFEQRIQALSTNQDLLINREWHGVELADLVRAQLAHLEDLVDRQITVSGPRVLITAAASQTLAMALHELATNASKYGALSSPDGQVQIRWSFPAGPDGRHRFSICWAEAGGPQVDPPAGKGFGTTVIGDMTRISLQAEVSIAYAPTGLVWQLECPIERLIVETGPEDNRELSLRLADAAMASDRVTASGAIPRILVVEDEVLVALALKETLTKADCNVLGPAGSIEQALALLAQEPCDAAVLDVRLGNETAEPIAEELARDGTPFVLVSGYNHRQLPPLLQGAPVIAKPVREQVLIRELRRLIGDGGDGRRKV